MYFTGIAMCKTEEELASVLGKLKGIPSAEVVQVGLEIEVNYDPKDTETEREIEENIARLTDIIEAVETHGISERRWS